MPRPNKRRGIFAEDHLAQRIAAVRDARGWTNDGLAKRMTDAGCPMTGSAIFKIEKAEPRRRIVVDELVTFAKVFAIPLDELLLAPEVAASKEATRLVIEWANAADAADPLIEAQNVAAEAIYDYLAANPDMEGIVNEALKTAGQGNHNLYAGGLEPPTRGKVG
jgi:transcriptional regulator with XRE-family HTH domain